MTLGEEIALESLEPADGLVQKPADLGDVSRDGEDLGANPVSDGCADVLGKRGLELRSRGRQRLDLRERSRVASIAAGAGRPAAASAIRCFARSSA